MAGKPKNLKDLRRMHDAAEARKSEAPEGAEGDAKVSAPRKTRVKSTKEKAPKKVKAPRAKRAKGKAVVRKRLVWAVWSSSMKEEGRYPYAELEAAETRAAELTARHRKTYFVQPIREVLVPEKASEKEAAAAASDE